MAEVTNPYESPRAEGFSAPAYSTKAASVFWFLLAAIVVNAAGFIRQVWAQSSGARWTLSNIGGAVFMIGAIAIVTAIVMLAAYGLLGICFRRRYPATRMSRIAAGVAFGVVVQLVGRLYLPIALAIGFVGWPPGIVSLPVGAIAAVVADRLIARLEDARRGRPELVS